MPWIPTTDGRMVVAQDQKVHRTRAIAEMMQQNTVLHTIKLYSDGRDQHIYADMIRPYLETNRYRPRVHTCYQESGYFAPETFAGAGTAKAESIRNKSNLLWMFLSGNPDAVLQSNADAEQVVEAAASAPVG
jgi:hypothetical protein